LSVVAIGFVYPYDDLSKRKYLRLDIAGSQMEEMRGFMGELELVVLWGTQIYMGSLMRWCFTQAFQEPGN
jgi:hypothetical protein